MKTTMIKNKSVWLLLLLSLGIAACRTQLPPEEVKIPLGKLSPDFMVSKWEMLPDWLTQDLPASWPALQQSCRALRLKPVWLPICAAAAKIANDDVLAQRTFYETWFTPYQVFNPDGTDSGLITGYYEPLLKGSRRPSKRFAYPIYGPPDDMLEVDMGELYPQFRGQRVRGRLEGKRVVPYFNRAEIDAGLAPALQGHELFWVENSIDLFFLQIQGSGRIELEDGRRVKIGYADQNGHQLRLHRQKAHRHGRTRNRKKLRCKASRTGQKKTPERLFTLLGQNPSYVFFRELPDTLSAPLGALGVPLTNEYSIAVDQHIIPLGVPVFLATTQPNSAEPFNRLMFAQDTGGAIRGAVRADFFWGFGEIAAARAGSMKQSGKMWVLFPRGGDRC